MSDLRNDLAVQAARSLDAKIEAAICAAFDEGMDFVRSCDLQYEAPDPFAIRDIFAPQTHAISYRAGAIAPDAETPPQFVRYRRPKDWRPGSRRHYVVADRFTGATPEIEAIASGEER